MDRRAFLRTVGGSATLGVTALSGCLGVSVGGGAAEYDVGMSTEAFRPKRIEATVGEPVVWRNTSSHAHTVTAYGDALPEGAAFFASGEVDGESAARDAWSSEMTGALYQGDTYEHAFRVPGEYGYFCVPHEREGMVGTVVVREATDGSAANGTDATE